MTSRFKRDMIFFVERTAFSSSQIARTKQWIDAAWAYAESKATDREAQAAIERQPHEPGFYKRVQEPREDAGC